MYLHTDKWKALRVIISDLHDVGLYDATQKKRDHVKWRNTDLVVVSEANEVHSMALSQAGAHQPKSHP